MYKSRPDAKLSERCSRKREPQVHEWSSKQAWVALVTGGGPRQRLTKKEGPLRGLKDLADRGVASELTSSISSVGLLMTAPRLRELH